MSVVVRNASPCVFQRNTSDYLQYAKTSFRMGTLILAKVRNLRKGD
jgi:hypothetical protein